MSVKFVSGDLFADDNINVYAQGCNCAGAMGKGIAVSFKQRWPKMYKEYKALCLDGKFTLGDVFVWKEDGKIIFNLGTQKSWRSKATFNAIEKSLGKMLINAKEMGLDYVA